MDQRRRAYDHWARHRQERRDQLLDGANRRPDRHRAEDPVGQRQVAPGQRVPDYLKGHLSADLPQTSYFPGAKPARLDELLDHPTDPHVEMEAGRCASPGRETAFKGRLELRNVTFGYAAQDPPLIRDVSFAVQPGQRIALVGTSGCGKSTIARLVAGLYAPWSGAILFDGRPREEWPRETLARSLAFVEQDLSFVSGTVRENLTLWDASISDDELAQVCRDALILDAILALPGGFEAHLSEGAANLSGGERQRLEIARALVVRPALLVLDEATSALDAGTEAAILRNLRRRGCACLIVAHRISTIRDCDEIVVLQNGHAVQRGTHRVLARQPGEYARLIREEDGDRLDGE